MTFSDKQTIAGSCSFSNYRSNLSNTLCFGLGLCLLANNFGRGLAFKPTSLTLVFLSIQSVGLTVSDFGLEPSVLRNRPLVLWMVVFMHLF